MDPSTDPRLVRTAASDLPLRRLVDVLETEGLESEMWRRAVLVRLTHVRELLAREAPGPADWLAARRTSVLRERNRLLDDLSAQRVQVLAHDDLDRVVLDLYRLVADVRHHLQKVRDLAYDEVEFEVGGSE